MQRRAPVLVVDLLRIAAAAGVVLHHLVAIARGHEGSPLAWFAPGLQLAPGGAWAAPGWVGVEIFFVISGYVILQSAQGVGAGTFLQRRALRLAPAAWVCASLTAAVLLVGSSMAGGTIVSRWVTALLFVPGTATIDPSYWTLELEVAFYLLIAAALRFGDAGAAERVAVRLGVASALFWIWGWSSGVGEVAVSVEWVRLTLLPHGVFFALGALLAASHRRKLTAAERGLTALFGVAALAEIVTHSAGIRHYVPDAPGSWAPALLFAGAVGLIATAARWQAPLDRLIGRARIVRVALLTYPLYLLHQVIGTATIARLVGSGWSTDAATMGAIGAVVALAAGVSGWAEPAVRAWLKAQLSRRRDLAPDSPATASPPIG